MDGRKKKMRENITTRKRMKKKRKRITKRRRRRKTRRRRKAKGKITGGERGRVESNPHSPGYNALTNQPPVSTRMHSP